MFHKTEVIGRLGRDPELAYTPSGKSVCKFSVAADSGWGENKETEWFNVVTWEKLAENCNQYLHKGSLVRVEGQQKTHEYDDKDGIKRKSVDLIARQVLFLDSKPQDKQEQGFPWEGKDQKKDTKQSREF